MSRKWNENVIDEIKMYFIFQKRKNLIYYNDKKISEQL